jgi:hypothetical protein
LAFDASKRNIEVQSMFLKSILGATLFTNLLAAAEPSTSDVFNIRSFRDPTIKAKVPVTAQLFGGNEGKMLAMEAEKNDKCSIPLPEVKTRKTGDSMAMPVGPMKVDPAAVIPPPVPTCKAWNQEQNQTAPSLNFRLR